MKKLFILFISFISVIFIDYNLYANNDDFFIEKKTIVRGDYEDYTRAKYFTLKQLEIPLVLDNYDKHILLVTSRPDLIPIYSFNGDSLYLAKQTDLGKEVLSV